MSTQMRPSHPRVTPAQVTVAILLALCVLHVAASPCTVESQSPGSKEGLILHPAGYAKHHKAFASPSQGSWQTGQTLTCPHPQEEGTLLQLNSCS